MVAAGLERIGRGIQISDSTLRILQPLFEKAYWAVEQSAFCLSGGASVIAERIIAAKPEIYNLTAEAQNHLLKRLTADQPHRIESFRIETDIIDNLNRLYYFAKRIAKMILEFDTNHVRPD